MESKILEISSKIEHLIDEMISLALKYEDLTHGRTVGITGEVGEVKTCKVLSLKLMPYQNPGYDAVGPDNTRYQIKTRRKKENKKAVRVPAFTNGEFDIALLTTLNAKYEIESIWKINKSEIISYLKERKGKLTIREFEKNGEKIYPPHSATKST